MSQAPDEKPISSDVLLVLLSLGAAAAGAYSIPFALWRYPSFATVLLIVIGLAASIGVITGLGSASHSLECRRRRHWVRFIGGDRLVYEERGPDGAVRGVSFGCAHVPLGQWRVLGWDVTMAAEGDWDSEVPEWARGRRAEIAKRIVDAFGGGTQFRFRSAAEQGVGAGEGHAG